MDQSSSATYNVFYTVMVWKGIQANVAKEIPGRGRRRSRNEKGNRGVGDFRFINILQLFSIYFFFFNHFSIISFYTFCYPRHLSLPTTHDPRHLATLDIMNTLYILVEETEIVRLVGGTYRKISKISPGAYIFQRPFLRGFFLEGLIYGGKFAFQNRLG